MDRTHILPINDIRAHVDFGGYCHCSPTIEQDGDYETVIHHSYDAREFYESDEEEIFEWESIRGVVNPTTPSEH